MLCTRQLWYHFSSRGDKGCGSDWIKVTCRLLSRSLKRSEKGTVDRLGCCCHHHHAQRTWGWFTKIATTTILLTLGPHSSVGTCHMNLASGQWEILQCQEAALHWCSALWARTVCCPTQPSQRQLLAADASSDTSPVVSVTALSQKGSTDQGVGICLATWLSRGGQIAGVKQWCLHGQEFCR